MALPIPVLQVPLLPHAGGGLLPRSQGRLRLHVSLWWCSYDCILPVVSVLLGLCLACRAPRV